MHFKLYYKHSGMHTIYVKYMWKVNTVHPNAAVKVLKLTFMFIPCLIY